MELHSIPEELQSRIRVGIISTLLDGEKTFAALKKITQTSDGNLSIHISKLEKGKYITVEKKFVGKKPKTICSITPYGRKQFVSYVQLLFSLLPEDERSNDS